jgi:hypothetical protein
MKKLIVTNLLALVGFLWLAVISVSCSETTSKTETTVVSSEPEIQVTAPELVKEYDANEVAADEKYKGKTVTVSGIIHDIGKDLGDDPYIILSSGEEMELTSVQCMFKDKGEVAKLSKGQKITVTGKIDGKLMNVLINDCQFKK